MPTPAGTTGSTRSPVPAPRRPLGHVPALDGVRAVAILSVVLFHTPGWGSFPRILPGGHMGVTVFFVLSGFLITTLLLAEHHRYGRIDLRAFWLRRGARLLPGLLVVAVVHTAFWSTQDGVVKTVLPVLAALAYAGSIFAGFWRLMGKITWSWSLSVEEHFYLVWPPVLIRLLRGARRRPMLAVGAAAAVIVAVATGLRVWFVDSVRWHDMLYYSTFTRMDALAVGCLAALFAWRYALPVPRLLGWLSAAVLAYCFVSPALSVGHASLNLWGLPLGTVAAAVLVTSVTQQRDALLARALSVRPLVHVGVVSYGLYLWNLLPGRALMELRGHHPGHILTVVSWLVILACVELSYRLVERPVLDWARARLRGERRPLWPRREPDLVHSPATEHARACIGRTAGWRVPAVVR
ncbi:MAG TPA: acyltransferase [Actinocatenispora sp.]